MLIFDAYSLRDLQNTLSILEHGETKGLTDTAAFIATLREQIYTSNDNSPKYKQQKRNRQLCPECGGQMYTVKNNDGLIIIGCQKCRYSEVVK